MAQERHYIAILAGVYTGSTMAYLSTENKEEVQCPVVLYNGPAASAETVVAILQKFYPGIDMHRVDIFTIH